MSCQSKNSVCFIEAWYKLFNMSTYFESKLLAFPNVKGHFSPKVIQTSGALL